MAGLAAKVMIVALVLVAVASAAPDRSAPICRDVTCPTSYMPGNYLVANPHDQCSYCQCEWGRPTRRPCAKGLGWSSLYSQCIPNPACE